MDRQEYTDESYSQPHVPPATAPAIDPNASPLDAATLAFENGDSDASGTNEASVDRGDEDAGISPSDTPDEIVPDQGDTAEPASPAEIEPQQDDTVSPSGIPGETLLPPD
jgi:hypothetical protein